ncbi:MAG TPA: DNA polymerase III subunit gamma/tau [Candidatus Paceibacterota bacterium]|nr:DNA polymerase III subunit gamma/tau [Candidatus Paceibacterota bacterium]
MSYLALYRRYRPKTFAEVIGQKPIIQTLCNALSTNHVSHAYLFCGQRGTGKTTVARLLAKAVNCENRKENECEPCNQCESCIEINEGRSLDLIEIDAASNRGIDEIRELKDGIRFAPVKSKYKVFIIDEVHMLTKEAFNALLKTLEEPPAHAIFILATTEPEKLPPTIISRTQRFDFKKLTLNEIITRLKILAEAEKINITPDALKEIALSAEGSLRDAESFLDQIISLGYKQIDLNTLEEVLGRVNFSKTAQFLDYLLAKDVKSAITFINSLYENGVDLINFSRTVLKLARQIMLLKINPQISQIIKDEFTEDQLEKVNQLAQDFPMDDLQKLIDSLLKIKEQIKYSPIQTLPLEMIVIQLCSKNS